MNAPVELTVEECLELLAGGVLGRVALCTPTGPRIVPMNYAVHDGSIVFRTTPHSELGTYADNTDLAFEIDDVDLDNHLGWSVVALGPARHVMDPEELREVRAGWDPTPWAGGRRYLYVRLRWRDLTGRRLGSLPTRPT